MSLQATGRLLAGCTLAGRLCREESCPLMGHRCSPQAHQAVSFCIWNPGAKPGAQHMANATGLSWMSVLEIPHRPLRLPRVTGCSLTFKRMSHLNHFEKLHFPGCTPGLLTPSSFERGPRIRIWYLCFLISKALAATESRRALLTQLNPLDPVTCRWTQGCLGHRAIQGEGVSHSS